MRLVPPLILPFELRGGGRTDTGCAWSTSATLAAGAGLSVLSSDGDEEEALLDDCRRWCVLRSEARHDKQAVEADRVGVAARCAARVMDEGIMSFSCTMYEYLAAVS